MKITKNEAHLFSLCLTTAGIVWHTNHMHTHSDRVKLKLHPRTPVKRWGTSSEGRLSSSCRITVKNRFANIKVEICYKNPFPGRPHEAYLPTVQGSNNTA